MRGESERHLQRHHHAGGAQRVAHHCPFIQHHHLVRRRRGFHNRKHPKWRLQSILCLDPKRTSHTGQWKRIKLGWSKQRRCGAMPANQQRRLCPSCPGILKHHNLNGIASRHPNRCHFRKHLSGLPRPLALITLSPCRRKKRAKSRLRPHPKKTKHS